uniref:LAGLIDADG endonuclease n=1 Tax=Auxenochlorella protothecoides TaxID=3075 RepID=A0A1Z1GBJ3_AUXPR|nr:LAGLIDADG endonuclease [Auxenochlorella protothecoides]
MQYIQNFLSMFSDKNFFKPWLSGLTDGDGTFVIVRKKDRPCSWYFIYKISLFTPNAQLLYFVKQQLGAGTVSIEKDMVSYRMQDLKSLNLILFPIFDTYPLLTVKQFRYEKFKKCLSVYENNMLSIDTKNNLLATIWGEKLPDNYRSHVWMYYLNQEDFKAKVLKCETRYHSDPHLIISKPWLSGFVEADGSFHLVKKSESRIVHAFGIAQKEDLHLLKAISVIFHIQAKIGYNKKKNYYTLSTTNSKCIENIIQYFTGPTNISRTMQGIKSFEFRIWAWAYKKYKGDYQKLHRIREIMRKLRKK